MPFFTVSTSISLSSAEKEEIIHFITKKTNELLNICFDKIQVLIQLKDKDCFGRAGVALTNNKFEIKSRVLKLEPMESYYETSNVIEEMVVIELDMWKNEDINHKSILFGEITDYFKKKFAMPGDNILILIRDMQPEAWVQNGIRGNDPLFLEKSRKI